MFSNSHILKLKCSPLRWRSEQKGSAVFRKKNTQPAEHPLKANAPGIEKCCASHHSIYNLNTTVSEHYSIWTPQNWVIFCSDFRTQNWLFADWAVKQKYQHVSHAPSPPHPVGTKTRLPTGSRPFWRQSPFTIMGFQNIWYSHPRKYGQGSRNWWVKTVVWSTKCHRIPEKHKNQIIFEVRTVFCWWTFARDFILLIQCNIARLLDGTVMSLLVPRCFAAREMPLHSSQWLIWKLLVCVCVCASALKILGTAKVAQVLHACTTEAKCGTDREATIWHVYLIFAAACAATDMVWSGSTVSTCAVSVSAPTQRTSASRRFVSIKLASPGYLNVDRSPQVSKQYPAGANVRVECGQIPFGSFWF